MLKNNGRNILFICEGSAEKAILENLIESGALNIPYSLLIEDPETGTPYTTKRKPSSIAETFLNLTYANGPVHIVRLIDSKNENFVLPRGYENHADVETLLTRPEIEILVILRENHYAQWNKSKKKPSDYCKTNLHMPKIKQYAFIKDYWSDIAALKNAIQEYDLRHKFANNEESLSELI